MCVLLASCDVIYHFRKDRAYAAANPNINPSPLIATHQSIKRKKIVQ